LQKHIQKWLQIGLLEQNQADKILDDYRKEKERNARNAINIVLYTIGAILIGIAAITFIAANEWILKLFYSRFVKISVSLAVTVFCLYLGCYFSYKKTEFKKLGNVLIFLSCLLIGGVWALIAQIYNVHTRQNGLIFLFWLISILPVAFLFRIKSVNTLGAVLFVLAFINSQLIFEKLETCAAIVFGLLSYNISNLACLRKNYPDFAAPYKGIALIVLFFSFYTIFAASYAVENFGETALSIAIIAAMAAFAGINYIMNTDRDWKIRAESAVIAIICASAIALCLAAQVLEGNVAVNVIASNAVLISVIYYLVKLGYGEHNARVIGFSNMSILLYIGLLYYKISYNLLDRALFFFIGGVIMLGAGIYLEKKKKNAIKKDDKKDPAEV